MSAYKNTILGIEDNSICCWLFNIGIEKEWSSQRFQMIDREEELVVQHMEEIMLLLADEKDILLMRHMPDERFMEKMLRLGFQKPQILCPKESDDSKSITELVLEDEILLAKLRAIAQEQSVYLVPYGVTEKEQRLGNLCGMMLQGSPGVVSRRANSKLYARQLATNLGLPCPEGVVCECIEDIPKAWERLKKNFSKVIIKRMYGASGQGLYLLDNIQKLHRVLHLLKRSDGNTGKWIVEGWYEDKTDWNAQLYIQEDGKVQIFSIKKQLLKDTVYHGSLFPMDSMDETMVQYKRQLEEVGQALYADGVRGVVGIDSIFTKEELFPVIEINVRFTLSTYLSMLPQMFEERYFQSMYYRVPRKEELEYTKLEEKLKQKKLLFEIGKKRGIFFYNHGCMAKENIGKTGRLFLVIVAEKWGEIKHMQQQLEQILEEK